MCNAELEEKKNIIDICKQYNYDCSKCHEHIKISDIITLKNGNIINTIKSQSDVIRSKQ
jgi:hypothetical protein